MQEELISKKELLQRYGISYGALYRWKRKGLIPEEWFIRQSTVTGQETFFVRELICARVEEILAQKDTSSLDELTEKLSHPHGQNARRLVIHMKYGEKSIYINDIRSIILYREDGSTEDISQSVLKITEI